jgi:hypothetical protein
LPAVISLNNFGRDDDGPLSEEERKVLEKLRDCEDIVHGWDDPADFSWWKPIFAKAFAPPPPRALGDC